MSEPVIDAVNQTWVNIIYSFLVVYTHCKRPQAGRGLNSRIKATLHNIEGFDLEGDAKYADHDKTNDEKK